ncbi:MAG: LL-diaminopimelate aminotransferase [Candidatus Improbicoccus devescovinae]|nr:MAG: LL-diaminopimelate aminotransferase [Candidatus Improbicoccus devescovinae]
MLKINKNFLNLSQKYLFDEIKHKVQKFKKANPEVPLLNLGIGDVVLPICQASVEASKKACTEMGDPRNFKGYGPSSGYDFLKSKICENYLKRGEKIRNKLLQINKGIPVEIDKNEVFIGDGSKTDICNILDLFAQDNICLIPNPVYPVYIDSNIMRNSQIIYANSTEKNNFLPMPSDKKADIIYICSPNNPTGAAYSRDQLKAWVDYALEQNSIILYDSAYEAYIRDDNIPHSIFEIENSKKCAIEFRSFSKNAGFTGMRCSYVIIPNELKFENIKLLDFWTRRQSTKYNGTCYIVQRAAEAALSDDGLIETENFLNTYKQNSDLILDIFSKNDITFFGGKNSPYIWFKYTNLNKNSWDLFDLFLQKTGIITTPGSGFGECGENFLRISTFFVNNNIDFFLKKILTFNTP